MIIEEEEIKSSGEINPDAIEVLLGDDSEMEESEILIFREEDEDADLLDLAFTEDEGHW